MKFIFMRKIDAWIGAPLCWLMGKLSPARIRPVPDPSDVREIVVAKFLGFGTIILSMPLVRALRHRFPSARITYLTFEMNRDILRMFPLVDRVVTVDPSRLLSIPFSSLRAAWRLRKGKVDICINLEFFSYYAALICSVVGARYSMGYGGFLEFRYRLLDGQVSYERGGHISEKMLEFAVALGGEGDDGHLERPVPGPAASARMDALLRGLPPPTRPLVAVYLCSGDKASKRKWLPERYGEVVRWLLEKKGATVFLIGGRSDRVETQGFTRSLGSPPRCIDLAGRVSLEELAVLLERCDLVLGNDGGPPHLAAALGTRTVTLFGPESPEKYGPPKEGGHHVVYSGLMCSPCLNIYTHKDSRCRDGRCMRAITVEAVIAACEKALGGAAGNGRDPHPPSSASVRTLPVDRAQYRAPSR